MAAIRSRDTAPELALRAALRSIGVTGYRVSPKNVAGRPDLAFTRWRLAVFVDGAFWHGHPEHFSPERASEYWRRKIAGNIARDARVTLRLQVAGWVVLRFWDFEVMKRRMEVTQQIADVLTVLGRRRVGLHVPAIEGRKP